MKQFFIESPSPHRGEVIFRGKDYHYLVTVKRLQVGSEFPGIDKDGNRYSLTVQDIKNSSLHCRIEKEDQTTSSSGNLPQIHLFQGFPKGKKMDLIVRQAAECGVMELTPLITANTVVQLTGREDRKLDRWNRIAQEALQQSGQSQPMQIRYPITLTKALSSSQGNPQQLEKSFFCHEKPLSKTPNPSLISGRLKLFVGPEGGFTPEEVILFQKSGVYPLFWGSFVLRTETAALYSIAALHVLSQKSSQEVSKPC